MLKVLDVTTLYLTWPCFLGIALESILKTTVGKYSFGDELTLVSPSIVFAHSWVPWIYLI
jgi:hypothetical protein